MALLPAAGVNAGTEVAHEPAGQWGGLPAASPDAQAAQARDKPDADQSGAQSCGVPPHPADQAVPVERHGLRLPRGHAVPQSRPRGEFEPYRTAPPLDDSPAADETELPALRAWPRVPGKLDECWPPAPAVVRLGTTQSPREALPTPVLRPMPPQAQLQRAQLPPKAAPGALRVQQRLYRFLPLRGVQGCLLEEPEPLAARLWRVAEQTPDVVALLSPV
jgi:hypothetical protein